VRMLILTPLLCAAIACKPGAMTGDEAGAALPGAAQAVQLQLYERRLAGSGEVLTPPVLLRLSGTLEQRNGCLIVTNGNGDHALVFEKGRVTFDQAGKALLVGSATFPLGGPISVGGPFNQPSESFDPAAVKQRCGVASVWLVTGADIRSNP
jgi:hypothetical protein